jgi:hypothetical protein
MGRTVPMAKDKFHSLFDTLADGARRLVDSEVECREQFVELSLLWARGAELCPTSVGPSRVRSHLSRPKISNFGM